MYLKRLDVQGFKTFATRTSFAFKPGITAIVGPNGSGKSNSADVVRWVLGEQSYAALRCKRTEELIYSGGGRRAGAGLAEATLTIDNSDRVLPLAFDEVTITRRATRAGENEYLINKARVRLRDVQELAAALGGSYVIINQGMVDAALTLRAEDRRRLFEDAAGIGGFEARQHEAERRLKETDGNLARVVDLVTELEPQLRSLKRQAGQARIQRELSAELGGLLAAHYRSLWQAANAGLAAAQEAEHDAAQARNAAAALVEQHTAALVEQRSALRGAREQLGSLHQQSAALHQQAEADQRALAVGSERLAAFATRRAESEQAQAELRTRQAEAGTELAQRQAQLHAATQNLEMLRQALHEAIHADAARDQALRAARDDVDAKQRALMRATTSHGEAVSRRQLLGARRTQLQQAGQAAADAHAQRAQELARAQQMQEQAEQALAAAQAATDKATQQQQAVAAKIDALRQQRGEAEEALSLARRRVADLEARFESLERLSRAQSGAFAGVRAALAWAEQERRGGFALVSGILRTPPELETAIEVALGSRLQNIVVEAWQDAEDAIAQLRRSNTGRATFLPLDTLKPPRPLPAPRGQGLRGIAADLVGYDPHYQKAIAQLLGRVLIVDDLASARRLLGQLEGGWLLVTLGGEQVSSGGAVTGGAHTRDSGTLRREREVRELPAQIDVQRAALADHSTAHADLGAQIAAQEQALRELRVLARERDQQQSRQREILLAAQRRCDSASRERDWQQRRSDEALHELAGLDVQEHALLEEIATLAQALTAAQASAEAVRQQLEQAQTADAERQQRLAEARAALAGAEGDARSARALHDAQTQVLARADAQLREAIRRLEAAVEEHDALSVRLAEAGQRHEGLLAQIEALRQQISPVEAAIAAAEQHLAASEAAFAQATSAQHERAAAYNRAELEVERARDRLALIWERAAADDLDVEQLAAEPLLANEAANDEASRDAQIAQLRQRLQRLGPVNPLALEEYEAANERHSFLSIQLQDLRQAAQALRELIAELQATMEARFAQTFEAVGKEFEQTFSQLFGGGAAKLVLSREGDEPEQEHEQNHNGARKQAKITGVDILARPPGKRQQQLALLSGGERSLTAVALLFAILRVNPSPFCILDEVDAALDEANVGRFREALSGLAERTQFVVITHNRSTIEAADTLYGITMSEDGSSKVLSLRLEELAV